MMIKKIALVGTHSSGKSTILKDVKKLLEKDGYSFVVGKEVARECPYKLNKDATFLTQWYCLSKQIEMEAQLGGNADQVILDRSVFDVLAYTFRQSKHKKISVEEYLVIKDAVRSWSDWFKYDILIRINPLPFVEDDGIRDTDVAYQKEIENIINTMLAFDVPPKTKIVYIDTLDREERCKQVYEIVKGVFRK